MKTIKQNARVILTSCKQTQGLTKLGVVGEGEVVQRKLWPALLSNGFLLSGVVVCSVEPTSVLNGLPHLYHRVEPDSLLPLDYLHEQGFLSADTLWIIATPSEVHVHYTLQLAGLCRIAVEKPVAATSRQARLLLPLALNGFEIYPLDHKLFNASPLAFVDDCWKNPSVLERVSRIEGVFYEITGFSRGRQQEDCVADVQWHLLAIIVAAFKAAGGRSFEVTVDEGWVSTHQPDPEGRFAAPKVWTASRLRGRVLWNGKEVTFDFCQAKGAPKNLKFLRLYEPKGVLIHEIDLNESGWQAHARLLQELMKPVPDMRHTLADAIAVMELVDVSRAIAHEEPPYAFGKLPPLSPVR